jgi:hypothetical protein
MTVAFRNAERRSVRIHYWELSWNDLAAGCAADELFALTTLLMKSMKHCSHLRHHGLKAANCWPTTNIDGRHEALTILEATVPPFYYFFITSSSS